MASECIDILEVKFWPDPRIISNQALSQGDKLSEKYLYVNSVAKRFNCSKKHIYKLIQDGEIKAIRLGTRALRITESSLKQFLEESEVNPQDYFE
jgi:excisionase family DNA binding protein